ncbi:hypothetical protein HPB48_021139 [Haemaphysalis longicornis]|uniref:Uncharacterized protein n=1 Tax=Haemaphysalis longicornis TaxID=44386 RepID=A0A9J6GAV4_HAELO|nr:hypothetical protein HPB48_021139 [Haemaphysalis longicornis]
MAGEVDGAGSPSIKSRWKTRRSSGFRDPSSKRVYRAPCHPVDQQTVLNVYMKLRGEHQHVGVKQTCRKTSEYTGVSFQKILDIKSKAKATGGKLTTPSRKRPRSENRKRRTAMYDGISLCALNDIVHDLSRRNEPPTAHQMAEEFRRTTMESQSSSDLGRKTTTAMGVQMTTSPASSKWSEAYHAAVFSSEAPNGSFKSPANVE